MTMTVDDLARHCLVETEKFNRRAESDPQYCFDLFRRALIDGDQEAFTRVYQTYERQVLGWVYRHSRFEQTGEDAVYFVQLAFSNFYFARRGERFAGFETLPQVLAYLKICVHTAIVQYHRDQRPSHTTPFDDLDAADETPALEEQASAAELWGQITQLLPDAHDRLLARCRFIQDLKPQQIREQYPTIWASEREISLAIYRIRQLLRNDPVIQDWLGRNDD